MKQQNASIWQNSHGGMNKCVITNKNGAHAEIYQYGAHVTGWRSESDKQWLFLSQQALFDAGKAIRGGVPIIFPQFNALGSGPRHGFARNRFWQLIATSTNCCTLTLSSDKETLAIWPHQFKAEFHVELRDHELRMTLEVHNTGNKPFAFTGALHTYFAIETLSKAVITGFEGHSYWNNDGSDFSERHLAKKPELTFSDAIDRVYFDVKNPLNLRDGGHRLRIRNEGFEDVVVWNPGAKATKTMIDMADHEYNTMLCVEAAVIDRPVTLEPGQSWAASQVLTEARA